MVHLASREIRLRGEWKSPALSFESFSYSDAQLSSGGLC